MFRWLFRRGSAPQVIDEIPFSIIVSAGPALHLTLAALRFYTKAAFAKIVLLVPEGSSYEASQSVEVVRLNQNGTLDDATRWTNNDVFVINDSPNDGPLHRQMQAQKLEVLELQICKPRTFACNDYFIRYMETAERQAWHERIRSTRAGQTKDAWFFGHRLGAKATKSKYAMAS